MCFEVIVMVNAQEGLDLSSQEEEEILRSTGSHQLPRDHNLGLREGKRVVAMEVNGAHAEVGAAEVDCQVQTLFQSVWLEVARQIGN